MMNKSELWVIQNARAIMQCNHALETLSDGYAKDILNDIVYGEHPCDTDDAIVGDMFRSLMLDHEVSLECAAKTYHAVMQILEARRGKNAKVSMGV